MRIFPATRRVILGLARASAVALGGRAVGVVNGVDNISSRFGPAPRLDDESGYLALFGG